MANEGQERTGEQFRRALNSEGRATGDSQSSKEHVYLKLAELQLRLAVQRWLPKLVVGMVVGWLGFVIVVTVLSGYEILDYHASVLVTLLGSATASIIGLLMKVVGYALPEKGRRT